MFLLGAGASVEAGVPATFDMTEMLAAEIGAAQEILPLSQIAQAITRRVHVQGGIVPAREEQLQGV